MLKIGIRVDGGYNIGLGHIQRCLALANQLKKKGAEIFFICKENRHIKDKVEQKSFTLLELKDNLTSEKDLKSTIGIIRKQKINIVITDSYAINEDYLVEIRKVVPFLVSIDDLANISFPSDVVINQNIYAKELNYHSSTGRTKFLLGPKYALLREEFSNLGKREVNEKVKNLLITLGGSDPFNLTPRILKILDRIRQDFKITVIIGPFFKNIVEIEKTAKEIDKKVELVYNSHKMSKIMLASDLAVTGGGTTLYEIGATGTPALAFCLAENQGENIKTMSEYGIVVNLGQGNKLIEERFYKKVDSLIENSKLRENMSELGQQLVDGKGIQRATIRLYKDYKS